MAKTLPGGINPEEFVYITSRRNQNIAYWKQFDDVGLLECRSEDGIEEMVTILGGTQTDYPEEFKRYFRPRCYFLPGSHLYVGINYSSVEIGRVTLDTAFHSETKKFYKVPVPHPCFHLQNYYNFMISKNGLFFVIGDPKPYIGKTFLHDYPMIELRLDTPLWLYESGK